MRLTLWKLTGEVNHSSGAGQESYYVITDEATTLPEAEAILPNAGRVYGDGTDRHWMTIDRIERLGELPTVYAAQPSS